MARRSLCRAAFRTSRMARSISDSFCRRMRLASALRDRRLRYSSSDSRERLSRILSALRAKRRALASGLSFHRCLLDADNGVILRYGDKEDKLLGPGGNPPPPPPTTVFSSVDVGVVLTSSGC